VAACQSAKWGREHAVEVSPAVGVAPPEPAVQQECGHRGPHNRCHMLLQDAEVHAAAGEPQHHAVRRREAGACSPVRSSWPVAGRRAVGMQHASQVQ
jgi:hypothetical protein